MVLMREGTNVGSLCKIEIVNAKLVESMPDTVDGVTIGNVTLADGAEWEDIYFTLDTTHFVESPVVVNGVEAYQLVVKWKIPKDRTAVIQYLMKSKSERYVARLKDTNGVIVLAGTPSEGCRLVHNIRDKGQNIRDSNHYIVELKLTREEPAAILQA